MVRFSNSAFDKLVDCLNGKPGSIQDWTPILKLSNEHLVTPALNITLKDCAVPTEVREYVNFLFTLNKERNIRLRDQAIEVIEALNGVEIEPILLKGVGFLLTETTDRLGARMLVDLDIMIPNNRVMCAIPALGALGYSFMFPSAGHVYGVFGRDQDVGSIDLHHHPPGLSGLYEQVAGSCAVLEVNRSRSLLPSAWVRMAHIVAHDLVHHRGFETGDLQLRGLWELNHLVHTSKPVRLSEVAGLFPPGRAESFMTTQFVALNRLFGTEIPVELEANIIGRIQYGRRIFQARHPVICSTAPYRLVVLISQRSYRLALRASGVD